MNNFSGPGKFDGDAIGIKAAVNAPKSSTFVNEQIRPGGKASIGNNNRSGQ